MTLLGKGFSPAWLVGLPVGQATWDRLDGTELDRAPASGRDWASILP